MAVFGIPDTTPNDDENCVSAALDMLERLKGFNKKREEDGLETISIGVGNQFRPCTLWKHWV